MQSIPYNRITFAPPSIEISPLANGGMILRSKQLLGPYSRCLGEMLEHWATTQPERVFLAERDSKGLWRKMTFAQTLTAVESLAQALLDRGLGPDKPLAILSENGIDHALLGLAAMHVGIPYSPISTAYSTMSTDLGKLKYILGLLEPGLVYASSSQRYAKALAEARNRGLETVASISEDGTTATLEGLLTTAPTHEVAEAFKQVGPETVAKILFTSGSTGHPKGVINTQRMMCANQQSIAQNWPFLSERPPVIVDWLPWNHTFGGNHNFNMMLKHGGTLYIDEGRPMPGLVEKTVANLKEVSPTLYFNVPRGFDMLLSYFERDEDLRNNFFRELDLTFYAGASLPQNIWDRLTEFSIQSRKKKLRFVSSWGATETSPMITMVNFEIERSGVIGLPAPGNELKLIPNAGKLEMRARGPNITPGYFKQPELTAKAFDEDGFYITGDAGRFDDPNDPAKGIQFDGRIAEDFKLMSGTWVHVGSLRVDTIAALAPIAQDVVITGHDREELGILIFPSQAGCLSLCPEEPKEAPLSVLIRRHEVREKLKNLLVAYGVKATGNSTRIMRAILMDEPPNIDAGEITDKGYINQRAVLTRRADLVDLLYNDNDPEVLRVKKLG